MSYTPQLIWDHHIQNFKAIEMSTIRQAIAYINSNVDDLLTIDLSLLVNLCALADILQLNTVKVRRNEIANMVFRDTAMLFGTQPFMIARRYKRNVQFFTNATVLMMIHETRENNDSQGYQDGSQAYTWDEATYMVDE